MPRDAAPVGAIPIFILWMFLIWLVIQLGAEFAYSTQFYDVYKLERNHRTVDQRFRNWLATRIATDCSARFLNGDDGPTTEESSQAHDAPPRLVDEIVERLVKRGILTSSDRGLLPARSPSALTVDDVVSAMMENDDTMVTARDNDPVHQILTEARSEREQSLGATTLESLAGQIEEDESQQTVDE